MSRRSRRSALTSVATVVAVGLVAAGVALSTQRSNDDPVLDGGADVVAPSTAPGAAGAPGDRSVTITTTGEDLPGGDVLARCATSSRNVVARYETRSLGEVVMQCGTSGQGYEHIRVRHTEDWQDVVAGHGSRDWDDAMLTAVRTVLERPAGGYPEDAGDGKVCFAAPVRFDDGSRPDAEPFVRVIVSETTSRVITAFPTADGGC